MEVGSIVYPYGKQSECEMFSFFCIIFTCPLVIHLKLVDAQGNYLFFAYLVFSHLYVDY